MLTQAEVRNPAPLARSRASGNPGGARQRFWVPAFAGTSGQIQSPPSWLSVVLAALALLIAGPAYGADPLRIVALGDSLTAGYGLDAERAKMRSSRPSASM